MLDIEIIKMEKEHLEQIEDVLQTEFDEFWNADVLSKELENPLSTYIVAINKEKVVGYAGLWQPLDEGHVTNIVTRKKCRGNKIATKMLEELINIAKSKNLKCVTLEVNVHNEIAINLYRKNDFKEVGKRPKYYNGVDDALIMTLDLFGDGEKTSQA